MYLIFCSFGTGEEEPETLLTDSGTERLTVLRMGERGWSALCWEADRYAPVVSAKQKATTDSGAVV